MWCTRWYLPLVLLPLPIAPSYFLVLFLLSTSLHARPCFYCVILLTALLLSSCYWPPAPIESSLNTPWSDNITTFSDALLSMMPDLPPEKLPQSIPILNHCWCDLASGELFEPFNITQWEVDSVQRMKRTLEAQIKKEIVDNPSRVKREYTHVTEPVSPPSNSTLLGDAQSAPANSTWRALWGSIWPFSKNMDSSSSSPPVSPQPKKLMEHSELPYPTPSPQTQETRTAVPIPLTPRNPFEFDLRPHGFDVIVDFSWSRRKADR